MEQSPASCPVCTLYLREGITLQSHLETHPKEQVIEALLKVTNGGTKQLSQSSASSKSTSRPSQIQSTLQAGSGSVEAFVPTHGYVPSNSAFLTQTQNYLSPQTHMTAAVTYQQFVTSNGSVVLPHYIQVPAIVPTNGSVPTIPHHSYPIVPHHSHAFAHTLYNPTYNPYIPQPYPLMQPIAAGFPVQQEANTQFPNVQTQSSSGSASTSNENNTRNSESVVKQVPSNTAKTVTKNPVKKPRLKRLPLRASTQTKFRVVKHLGSHTKTTTSTLSSIATKSYRIQSVNSKTNSTAKTSVITKAKSLKTKSQSLLPTPSSLSSTSRIISPPPLTPMRRSRSSSQSCSGTPPPPPLSKAPCLSPLPPTYSLPGIVKTERSAPAEAGEGEANGDPVDGDSANVRSVSRFFCSSARQETQSMNSVIVESSNAVQIMNNIVVSQPVRRGDEGEKETVRPEDESTIDESKLDSESAPREKAVVYPAEQDGESLDEGGDLCGEDFPNEEPREGNELDLEEELDGKWLHSIEFEEKKVEFNFEIERQDTEIEVTGCREDGSAGEETENRASEACGENEGNDAAGRAPVDAPSYGATAPRIVRREADRVSPPGKVREGRLTNEVVLHTREVNGVSTDMKSVTYTDLQPATNSKVLQDLGITSSIGFSNYMEVDGIRIIFSNSGSQNLPLEPIIKFSSSVKGDATNSQSYMKCEGESRTEETIADSVIQVVSGTGAAQKGELNKEGFPNSSTHPSEGGLDARDLSPLSLNIQADESMPARGELSEQESLCADNSNWGLFRSGNGAPKPPEVWKTEESCGVITAGDDLKNEKAMDKTFKCSLCSEVFSNPKERRSHRSLAHDKSGSTARKQRIFICPHCRTPFMTLRERKLHVIQNHYFEAPVNCQQIKQEVSEGGREVAAAEKGNNGIAPVVCSVKREEEQQPSIKCETAAATQTNKVTTTSLDFSKNCVYCNILVIGKKRYAEHLKEVHAVSRYKCSTCPQTFEKESDYNDHLQIHPLRCTDCGKTFYKKANLKLHLKRHLMVKPYGCTICPKTFITRQKLREHMNGHSGSKPLKCPLCDKSFSRHSNLIQHRNSHHFKKKVKDFVCRCGEVFHSQRKLEWHKELHDPKPKTCPFCSQKFIHSNSVTRHIRRSHMPEYHPDVKKENENVRCPICDKVYLRTSLGVHMRVHNGEKPFACKICSKRFTTKWNLELHNWTHQSRNNMPYKCNICKSAFFREVDFVAHLNSHRNYRPFTCNICGQKFIRKYNCLRHQEEHKKEKGFMCTVTGCGKTFHRSYYLRDHMRVHTGVRPHTCHICGKASSTKSNHNKHIRIHDTREPVNTEN